MSLQQTLQFPFSVENFGICTVSYTDGSIDGGFCWSNFGIPNSSNLARLQTTSSLKFYKQYLCGLFINSLPGLFFLRLK